MKWSPLLSIFALFQAGPPRVPPNADSGDGAAIIFMALVAIFYLLVAGAFIAIGNALSHVVKPGAGAQVPIFVVSLFVSGLAVWLLWNPLRTIFASLAEWTWIGLLLIFGVLFLITVIASVISGLKDQFSTQNIVGTLSLIAIGAFTLYMYGFLGLSFWFSVGVSFAFILALNIVGILIVMLAGKVTGPRHDGR
ncbi:MAG TPA: hypothetical protein VNA22_02635 [Pyrinomonadaceae bacterium]|nr:hypothetical protein [Pyrinomonadaceae bacterium]